MHHQDELHLDRYILKKLERPNLAVKEAEVAEEVEEAGEAGQGDPVGVGEVVVGVVEAVVVGVVGVEEAGAVVEEVEGVEVNRARKGPARDQVDRRVAVEAGVGEAANARARNQETSTSYPDPVTSGATS
jgi:hypothetical protein